MWILLAVERGAGIDPRESTWLRRNAMVVNWFLNALVSAFAMTLVFRLGLRLAIPPGASAAVLGMNTHLSIVPPVAAIALAVAVVIHAAIAEAPRRTVRGTRGLIGSVIRVLDSSKPELVGRERRQVRWDASDGVGYSLGELIVKMARATNEVNTLLRGPG
jgi:hypothetical protein